MLGIGLEYLRAVQHLLELSKEVSLDSPSKNLSHIRRFSLLIVV